MFTMHASHSYLLLGRQPIIVDAGTPGSGRLIHDQVAAHGADPKGVRLIVVTHGHIDHFGSAAELSRLTGAPIAGHIADPVTVPAGPDAERSNRQHLGRRLPPGWQGPPRGGGAVGTSGGT